MRRILLASLVLMMACAGSRTPGGIHAKLAYSEEGGLRIVEVPEGGAAAKSGLREDDLIIAIDGVPVRELHYVEVVERLRGAAGSQVEIEFVRDGVAQTVPVTRSPYVRQ